MSIIVDVNKKVTADLILLVTGYENQSDFCIGLTGYYINMCLTV
jgi:hypothetical protein